MTRCRHARTTWPTTYFLRGKLMSYKHCLDCGDRIDSTGVPR